MLGYPIFVIRWAHSTRRATNVIGVKSAPFVTTITDTRVCSQLLAFGTQDTRRMYTLQTESKTLSDTQCKDSSFFVKFLILDGIPRWQMFECVESWCKTLFPGAWLCECKTETVADHFTYKNTLSELFAGDRRRAISLLYPSIVF